MEKAADVAIGPAPVAAIRLPVVPLVFQHHLAADVSAAALEARQRGSCAVGSPAALLRRYRLAMLRLDFGGVRPACGAGTQPPCPGLFRLPGRGDLHGPGHPVSATEVGDAVDGPRRLLQ